jgi:hypothetical protein
VAFLEPALRRDGLTKMATGCLSDPSTATKEQGMVSPTSRAPDNAYRVPVVLDGE